MTAQAVMEIAGRRFPLVDPDDFTLGEWERVKAATFLGPREFTEGLGALDTGVWRLMLRMSAEKAGVDLTDDDIGGVNLARLVATLAWGDDADPPAGAATAAPSNENGGNASTATGNGEPGSETSPQATTLDSSGAPR